MTAVALTNAHAIQSWCVDYVARILNMNKSDVDPNMELERFGLDSSTAVALIMDLETQLNIELAPELLFAYPTFAKLSQHLETLLPLRTRVA
jgi:acyl carrier protein